MIAVIVAPAGVRSIAMMRACLVSGLAADLGDVGVDRSRDAGLAVFRAVERVAAFGLVLGLVTGFLRGSRGAIRRTTSAPPGRNTRQGQIPKRASAAPSHHSNAPIKPESQSILSKIVALTPKEARVRRYGFCAIGAMLRPRYSANIVQNWLPALDGVVAKLERGAKVADVGCGTGNSTFIMARAFPNSTFVGYDFHEPSIEHATAYARQSGGAGNARFEVAKAKDFPAKHLDLVTCYDVLHDLGDPVGAAAHIYRSLKPDGTWMLMEPLAGDATEDNLGPVGRLAYAFSTMACVPVSLSQEVGMALGRRSRRSHHR
jgi:SAM-dependent methyltransferase